MEAANGNENDDKRKRNEFDDKPQQPPKKKKKSWKEHAVYGNYRNYYGYRIGRDMEEDPRLKVMKKEWFEGKDCLDIGCNVGLITISIAKKFGCRSILGIDIDGDRIRDANSALQDAMETDMAKSSSEISKSRNSESDSSMDTNPIESLNEEERDSNANSWHVEAKYLSKIVSFQKENFVGNPVNPWAPTKIHYHAILCLSVSKWIHLNWGDEGLITLFAKVWRLLHPDGVFILEPQPWSSYYNNRLVSETCSANYKSIRIRPPDFQEILLDKIGFRRVENLTSGLTGTKTGFNRPILAFWK